MFGKLGQKFKESRDRKRLAKHQKRDAELGTPTKATLNERAEEAAWEGHWQTVIAAIKQGADVNHVATKTISRSSYDDRKDYPLTAIAIEQENPAALAALLELGADRLATATYTHYIHPISYSLPQFAAHDGDAATMAVLLNAGTAGQQAELNGALEIAAGSKKKTEMVKELLAKGALGFEKALRSAENIHNDEAVKLIRAAEKLAQEAPKPDTESGVLRRTEAIAKVLDEASEAERRAVIVKLQKKYVRDFEAVAPKPAPPAPEKPAAPAPVQRPALQP